MIQPRDISTIHQMVTINEIPMADTCGLMQSQLIENEINELKAKLEDAQTRLSAVNGTVSRASPSEPVISNNGLLLHTYQPQQIIS